MAWTAAGGGVAPGCVAGTHRTGGGGDLSCQRLEALPHRELGTPWPHPGNPLRPGGPQSPVASDLISVRATAQQTGTLLGLVTTVRATSTPRHTGHQIGKTKRECPERDPRAPAVGSVLV